MFEDDFKKRYTTVPIAIYRGFCADGTLDVITHQHREIELIAITEGAADFYINSQRYHIKNGDILVIPPYALHRAQSSENELVSYYCICFDLSVLCDEVLKKGLEMQALSCEGLISSDVGYAEQLQGYIREAFFACEQKKSGWELRAIGNMSLMFSELKSKGFFTQKHENSVDKSFGRRIMTYIIDNYSSPITSHDAAAALYMNHSYFCRIFKKTFGIRFANYLLAYRLEKAKSSLSHTSLSVTEVAYGVGFNDCSYFCKVFKSWCGISPLAYRKSAR